MECNREDAYHAKEIAAKKFNEKDIIGAKKFAEKAQRLYPQLEGISGFLANIELHLHAESPNEETDWYKVLGVDNTATKETISKQYRKMALIHHPDKNREVGAESAFKLLSAASDILMDDASRYAYDQRIKYKAFTSTTMSTPPMSSNLNTPTPTYTTFFETPSWAHPNFGEYDWSSANLFANFFQTTSSSVPQQPKASRKEKSKKERKSSSQPKPPTKVRASKTPLRKSSGCKGGSSGLQNSKSKICSSVADRIGLTSFWTKCNGCKTRFEYEVIWLNEYMQCAICGEVFQALEILVPSCFSNDPKSFSSFDEKGKGSSDKVEGSSMPNDDDHAFASCGPSVTNMGKPSNDRTKQKRKADGDAKVESKRQKKTEETLVREHGDILSDPIEINNGNNSNNNNNNSKNCDDNDNTTTTTNNNNKYKIGGTRITKELYRKTLKEYALSKIGKELERRRSANEAATIKEQAMPGTEEKLDGSS